MPSFKSGQSSPRSLLPQAVVAALTALIDDIPNDLPSETRVNLRTLRSGLCRAFRLEDPQRPLSHTENEQLLAEEDGDALQD